MDSIRRSINRHVIQTLVSSLSPGDEVPHDESILRSIEAITHHVQVDAKIKVEEKKVADIEQPDELSMSAVAVAVQQPKNSLPEEIPSGGGIPSGRVDDNDTTDVEAFRRLRCRPQTTRHPFFSNTLLLGLSIVRVNALTRNFLRFTTCRQKAVPSKDGAVVLSYRREGV